MIHVLVGTNEIDVAAIRAQAVSKSRALPIWVIPKRAAVGDEVVLFAHSEGFLAKARIGSAPKPGLFRNRNVYRGALRELVLLPHPVPLEHVARHVRGWGWLRQKMKSYTTPSEEIAEALLGIVDTYRGDREKPTLSSATSNSREAPTSNRRAGGMRVRELIRLLQKQNPTNHVYVSVTIHHAREIAVWQLREDGIVAMGFQPTAIEPSQKGDTTITLERPNMSDREA